MYLYIKKHIYIISIKTYKLLELNTLLCHDSPRVAIKGLKFDLIFEINNLISDK